MSTNYVSGIGITVQNKTKLHTFLEPTVIKYGM